MALLQKGYLGATPLWRDILWYQGSPGLIVDASNSVTLTANASAHTKGSWSEVIASTSANASFLMVTVGGVGASSTNTATLLDIATGSTGNETAIASNIAVGGANTAATGNSTFGTPGVVFGFPFKVPSGTRISARIQSVVTGGKTAIIDIFAINAGDYNNSPTSVDVIGGDTATSQGISYSGASGNWVEAIASTSRAYRAVAVVLSGHNATLSNTSGRIFELGVGATSSEVQFGTVRHQFTTGELSHSIQPFTYLFGRNIPAGSRLAMQNRIATNPERYGFTLIGIP